jgi:hypothetical protein
MSWGILCIMFPSPALNCYILLGGNFLHLAHSYALVFFACGVVVTRVPIVCALLNIYGLHDGGL